MRERGLRLTAQRAAVLEYLLSTDEHPTARRIFESVRRSLPGIALSTVYGILAELSRNGIINALEFNERDNRYEANLAQHINLICLRCGKISDYVPPYTVDLERIREATRFRTLRSRFELYGLCEACGGGGEETIIWNHSKKRRIVPPAGVGVGSPLTRRPIQTDKKRRKK